MDRILLHLIPASTYALLSFVLWKSVHHPARGGTGSACRTLLAAGLLTHAYTLGSMMLGDGVVHFGLALALSLTLWLALLLYFAESFVTRIDSLLLFALPLTSIACLLPALLPGSVEVRVASWAFRLHFVVAMLAYSFFALAALHAVMLAMAERQLHRGQLDQPLGTLPPLLTLEKLLFRLIAISFLLLTLTLATGLLYSGEGASRPLTVKYKFGFTATAWLVFGVLLAGRRFRGWRGRIALRWTAAGFVFLTLAYAGTHFVLEFLLRA